MIEKLTLIGGASAYVPGLVKALVARSKGLSLRELRLYDIDEKRLEIVAGLCSKMAFAADAAFRVVAATSLQRALEGVDAVLNTARPGGLAARHLDETLPLEFGIPGQETVGPGGFLFALRSVPAALALAAELRVQAPGALLLNYTNPTSIVTQALVDGGYERVIGLCDQSDEDLEAVGAAFGYGDAAYHFRCVGLNHATWYSELTYGDAPFPHKPRALPAVAIERDDKALRLKLSHGLAQQHPGFWPNSYLPYYSHPDKFVRLAQGGPSRAQAIEASMEGYYRHFAEEARKDRPELRHHRGSSGFSDLALRTIEALEGDTAQTLVLNLPNQGSSPLFEAATVVECQATVSRSALVRESAPELPAGWQAWMQRLERYQRAAARAASEGGTALLVEALAENPLVPRREVAEKLLRRARSVYGDQIAVLR